MKSAILAGLVVVGLFPQASVAATYTYVGETYSSFSYDELGCDTAINYDCRGSYASDDRLKLDFWIDGALAANLTDFDLVAEGIAHSFTGFDGVNQFSGSSDFATFSTDAYGSIIDWEVSVFGSGPDRDEFRTTSDGDDVSYQVEFQRSFELPPEGIGFEVASASASAGTWTRTDVPAVAAVPLPAGALLLLSGLAGAAALRRRKSGLAA